MQNYRRPVYRPKVVLGIVLGNSLLWTDNSYLGTSAGADCIFHFSSVLLLLLFVSSGKPALASLQICDRWTTWGRGWVCFWSNHNHNLPQCFHLIFRCLGARDSNHDPLANRIASESRNLKNLKRDKNSQDITAIRTNFGVEIRIVRFQIAADF